MAEAGQLAGDVDQRGYGQQRGSMQGTNAMGRIITIPVSDITATTPASPSGPHRQSLSPAPPPADATSINVPRDNDEDPNEDGRNPCPTDKTLCACSCCFFMPFLAKLGYLRGKFVLKRAKKIWYNPFVWLYGLIWLALTIIHNLSWFILLTVVCVGKCLGGFWATVSDGIQTQVVTVYVHEGTSDSEVRRMAQAKRDEQECCWFMFCAMLFLWLLAYYYMVNEKKKEERKKKRKK